MIENHLSNSPDETFRIGEQVGVSLVGGEVVLLNGALGAGKTLLTKGIVGSLGFDIDEVTSPSFTLVNLYRAERFDVYHIDLWRLDGDIDAKAAVGLDEIVENENAVTIIEWPERLGTFSFSNPSIRVRIEGDGDDPRNISIENINER